MNNNFQSARNTQDLQNESVRSPVFGQYIRENDPNGSPFCNQLNQLIQSADQFDGNDNEFNHRNQLLDPREENKDIPADVSTSASHSVQRRSLIVSNSLASASRSNRNRSRIDVIMPERQPENPGSLARPGNPQRIPDEVAAQNLQLNDQNRGQQNIDQVNEPLEVDSNVQRLVDPFQLPIRPLFPDPVFQVIRQSNDSSQNSQAQNLINGQGQAQNQNPGQQNPLNQPNYFQQAMPNLDQLRQQFLQQNVDRPGLYAGVGVVPARNNHRNIADLVNPRNRIYGSAPIVPNDQNISTENSQFNVETDDFISIIGLKMLNTVTLQNCVQLFQTHQRWVTQAQLTNDSFVAQVQQANSVEFKQYFLANQKLLKQGFQKLFEYYTYKGVSYSPIIPSELRQPLRANVFTLIPLPKIGSELNNTFVRWFNIKIDEHIRKIQFSQETQATVLDSVPHLYFKIFCELANRMQGSKITLSKGFMAKKDNPPIKAVRYEFDLNVKALIQGNIPNFRLTPFVPQQTIDFAVDYAQMIQLAIAFPFWAPSTIPNRMMNRRFNIVARLAFGQKFPALRYIDVSTESNPLPNTFNLLQGLLDYLEYIYISDYFLNFASLSLGQLTQVVLVSLIMKTSAPSEFQDFVFSGFEYDHAKTVDNIQIKQFNGMARQDVLKTTFKDLKIAVVDPGTENDVQYSEYIDEIGVRNVVGTLQVRAKHQAQVNRTFYINYMTIVQFATGFVFNNMITDMISKNAIFGENQLLDICRKPMSSTSQMNSFDHKLMMKWRASCVSQKVKPIMVPFAMTIEDFKQEQKPKVQEIESGNKLQTPKVTQQKAEQVAQTPKKPKNKRKQKKPKVQTPAQDKPMAEQQAPKKQKAPKKCRFGDNCNRKDTCKFTHEKNQQIAPQEADKNQK